MKINFTKFSIFAKVPTKVPTGSTGFDLYSSNDVHCQPRSCSIIHTYIGFEIPPGYFGKIQPRSSFAQLFTDISGEVIDSDYRGRVSVAFFNFSNNCWFIKKGERLAQIVFQKIADSLEPEEMEELSETSHNFSSFCSTNKKVWQNFHQQIGSEIC